MPDSIQKLPPDPIPLPKDVPPNSPIVAQPKHPCRYSVIGLTHLKTELQNMIATHPEISKELKAVLAAELAGKTSNAASVDLHVVDHANGDSSIHLHVKQIKLG